MTGTRRQLKSRNAALAQSIARRLSRSPLTPNQISLASIGFAAAAAACLLLLPSAHPTGLAAWLLPLLAAVAVQGRLLCNLFDGMVAVEGGKGGPSGELFNDAPDRLADALILVAAGYAAGWVALGWLAALLAVMTAYVRTLGSSLGVPADFRGPMAKQHRMAVVTAACLLSAVANPIWPLAGYLLLAALLLINTGCVVTLYRRLVYAYRYLERPDGV